MELKALEINLQYGQWFWITLLSFDCGEQSRSFLHIEKNGSMWKFQFLWLSNHCWIINQNI